MIKIAQLGCGYWGPNLLRNLTRMERCDTRWLVEPNPDRQAYAKKMFPGVGVTDDLDRALADVDAVVVATPAATHTDLADRCLEAGCHVLIEKPFALTYPAARRTANLARDKDRVLLAGHTFLYNAAVLHLRELVESGDLGEVYYLYTQRLNFGRVRQDVNAWWNFAPHDVSMLLYLFGNQLPEQIHVQGMDYLQRGIEDLVFASLQWENGVVGHFHLSWLDPRKVRRTTLVGSHKMAVYDDVQPDKITIHDKGFERQGPWEDPMYYDTLDLQPPTPRIGDIHIPHIDMIEPLKSEIDHFLDCIEGKAEPLSGPEHGCDVTAVLAAGQRSLDFKRPVLIEEILKRDS